MDKDYTSNVAGKNIVGDIVVGLDIGTTKVATVIGYKNSKGKIEILGHGKAESKGVEYGLIKNILKTSDSIKNSAQIAMNHAKCDEINEVYAGIAARHIKTVDCKHYILRPDHNDLIEQHELDVMKSDVENIALPPGQKIITVIPQKYIIEDTAFGTSHESIDPVGEMGSKITGCYQILTGNCQEINKIDQCISRVSMTAKELILEPIASGLSCLSENEKREGVALIDIGGGTTDMVIFKDGHPVFCKVIPLGGSIITKDIASVCHIPEDTAEELKKNHGSCLPTKSNPNKVSTILRPNQQTPLKISDEQLARIIYHRVHEDILKFVKQALEKSGYMEMLQNGAGLVLTGGGANLRHLLELCQFDLGLNTRLGIPGVGFSETVPNELRQPLYSTALGLLKYGIAANPCEENMADFEIEEEVRKPIIDNKKQTRPTGNRGQSLWDTLKDTFTKIFEQIS